MLIQVLSDWKIDTVWHNKEMRNHFFWNYTKKSHQVELEEKVIFDDKDCYKLKVTLPDSIEGK